MPAHFEDCLTEVRCRSTKGYGTGYLIAPGLVLTALHVVVSSLADLPPPDIEIRTVAHFRKRVDFQVAQLIWPPAARWAELSGIDIALLEIKPDTITQAAARRIQLGSEGLPRNKELQINFAGFPRLMQIEDSGNRDAKQMFGEAAPVSGIKQNLIEITIKGRQAESDEGWKGASGAAVFVDEQIVAVLSVKVVAGMVDFKAMRLDAALADQDFRTRVSRALPAAPMPLPDQTDFDLGRLVCLVDRDPQETAFRTAFREMLFGQPVQPLCCLIYGEARHRPVELMTRFASVTIPELRKLREPLRFWPISWPKGDVDVANNLATLRGLLWNHLSDSDGSQPPSSSSEFKERLSDESRPHLFSTELAASQLTPDGAALWGAWLSFFDSISSCGLTRAPVHVFLSSNVNRPQIEAWLKHVPPTKETKRHPLDELTTCDWIEFDDWISQRVPRIAPAFAAAAARLKGDLEHELESMIGEPGPFTVSDLKQAVRSITKRAQSGGR
jgi:inactive STAND/Trypsin